MSLTLTLSEPLQARLHAVAEREKRSPEEVAARLLAESLMGELPGAIVEGSLEEAQAIREGWADYEAGRYRPLDQYVADLQKRHGITL